MKTISRSRDLGFVAWMLVLPHRTGGTGLDRRWDESLRRLIILPLVSGGIPPHQRLTVWPRTPIWSRHDRDEFEVIRSPRLPATGARRAAGERRPSGWHSDLER